MKAEQPRKNPEPKRRFRVHEIFDGHAIKGPDAYFLRVRYYEGLRIARALNLLEAVTCGELIVKEAEQR